MHTLLNIFVQKSENVKNLRCTILVRNPRYVLDMLSSFWMNDICMLEWCLYTRFSYLITDSSFFGYFQLSAEQKLEVYLTQYKMAPVFADILNRLAFESLDDAFKVGYLFQCYNSDHVSKVSRFCCLTMEVEAVTHAIQWLASHRDAQITHAIILTDSVNLLQKIESGMGCPD